MGNNYRQYAAPAPVYKIGMKRDQYNLPIHYSGQEQLPNDPVTGKPIVGPGQHDNGTSRVQSMTGVGIADKGVSGFTQFQNPYLSQNQGNQIIQRPAGSISSGPAGAAIPDAGTYVERGAPAVVAQPWNAPIKTPTGYVAPVQVQGPDGSVQTRSVPTTVNPTQVVRDRFAASGLDFDKMAPDQRAETIRGWGTSGNTGTVVAREEAPGTFVPDAQTQSQVAKTGSVTINRKYQTPGQSPLAWGNNGKSDRAPNTMASTGRIVDNTGDRTAEVAAATQPKPFLDNELQKQLVEKYPEIGKPGSPENQAFLAAYAKGFDPSKPMTLDQLTAMAGSVFNKPNAGAAQAQAGSSPETPHVDLTSVQTSSATGSASLASNPPPVASENTLPPSGGSSANRSLGGAKDLGTLSIPLDARQASAAANARNANDAAAMASAQQAQAKQGLAQAQQQQQNLNLSNASVANAAQQTQQAQAKTQGIVAQTNALNQPQPGKYQPTASASNSAPPASVPDVATHVGASAPVPPAGSEWQAPTPSSESPNAVQPAAAPSGATPTAGPDDAKKKKDSEPFADASQPSGFSFA